MWSGRFDFNIRWSLCGVLLLGSGVLVCQRFRASAEERQKRQSWQSSSPGSKGFKVVDGLRL